MRPNLLGLALAALIAVGAGSVAYLAHAWAPLEGDTVDLRFGLRSAEPPNDVAVVGIDERTFSEIGEQWPFRRSLHARAIDRLRRAGARAIAYDVQFTEPTSSREDLALYHAAQRARRVVFATTEVDQHGHTNVLGGDANLARIGARAGASNLPADRGGVIRRFNHDESRLETFAVAAVEQATGRQVPESRFDTDGAWIDYRGAPGTIPTVPFSELVNGEVDPQFFQDKIVIVGATAPTLQDLHPAPTATRDPMSGPEIQANAVWTALHKMPLQEAPTWLNLLAILALGLVAPLAGLGLRGLRSVFVFPVALVVYFAVAKVAFDSGTIVAFTYPLTALAVGTVATVTLGYIGETRERRRIARYNQMLEIEVRKRTEELRETQLEIARRLGQAADSRDGALGEHVERISAMCFQLGLAAGMTVDDAEVLRDASALHDVGKIGIPDSILLKPGQLTRDERGIMETHTTIGSDILAGSRSPLVQMAELIARTHHERWDGTGYPAGLRGTEIPLVGRITAICDVFDALMSKRTYKEGWSLRSALTEIRSQSGRAFDPGLVDLFVECVADTHGNHRVTVMPAPGERAGVAGGSPRPSLG